MAKIFRYVSLSDLLMNKEFARAYAEGDKEKIDFLLYEIGLDVKHGCDEIFVTHRNLRNQIVSCNRFESVERQDLQWLKSPHCSTENLIASSDPSLAADLRSMNKEGFSGKFEEFAQEYVRRGGPTKLND